MIDKELEELGNYCDELENKSPIELIENFIKYFEGEIKNLSEEEEKKGKWFGKDVVSSIEEYSKKEVGNDLISYHLLNILVSNIKLGLIEEKADILGIEKNLYKSEMRFLFKGKY